MCFVSVRESQCGPPRLRALSPSARAACTEQILALIGGGNLLVGRSHECDFPKDFSSVPVLSKPQPAEDPRASRGSRAVRRGPRAAGGDRLAAEIIDLGFNR